MMIRMHACAEGQHLTCTKWFAPEYVCQCPCHEAIYEVLEALEADGVNVDECDDDVIENALVKVLEGLGSQP